MVMPRLTVSNYPEMLRKLSTAMFFIAAACVTLLRSKIGVIDEFLRPLDISDIPIFTAIKIPFGSFLIAFAMAFASEAIKLHDAISSVLGIRFKFDVRWILIPMALLSGARIAFGQFQKIKTERDRLMGEVFYEYA